MQVDKEDNTIQLVQRFNEEALGYFRQLHIWLGTASAGGAIALATLAGRLPNPGFAFRFFSVSFWLFLLGIVSSGVAILAMAMRASSKGEHYASAHNRDVAEDILRKNPPMMTSPPSLAKRKNAWRDEFIDLQNSEHQLAELSWMKQTRWFAVWVIALSISVSSFIAGFAWPLVHIDELESHLTQPSPPDQAN